MSVAERINGRDMGRYHTIEQDTETLRPPWKSHREEFDFAAIVLACLSTSWRKYFLLQISVRHEDFISIVPVALSTLSPIS